MCILKHKVYDLIKPDAFWDFMMQQDISPSIFLLVSSMLGLTENVVTFISNYWVQIQCQCSKFYRRDRYHLFQFLELVKLIAYFQISRCLSLGIAIRDAMFIQINKVSNCEWWWLSHIFHVTYAHDHTSTHT